MKKPSLKRFREVSDSCQGTIGKIATAFGVWRTTVYDWCKSDPAYQAVIDEYKGRLLDDCLKSAKILAQGIPQLNEKHQVVGWKERPDGYMLRYLISTLGRREGYGDAIDVTSKGESIKPEPVIIEVIDKREQVAEADNGDDTVLESLSSTMGRSKE